MATLKFKNEAEFQKWRNGTAHGSSNIGFTLAISPWVKGALKAIAWWMVGFIVGIAMR